MSLLRLREVTPIEPPQPLKPEEMSTRKARAFIRRTVLAQFRSKLNDAEVEDIVQKAWWQAIQAENSFIDGNFEAWLNTITRNIALKYIRWRARQGKIGGMPSEKDVSESATWVGQMGNQKDWEDRVRLEKLMKDLSSEQREALLLNAEGLSHREIADRLQLPLGTVKTRILDGQRKMRKAAGQD